MAHTRKAALKTEKNVTRDVKEGLSAVKVWYAGIKKLCDERNKTYINKGGNFKGVTMI